MPRRVFVLLLAATPLLGAASFLAQAPSTQMPPPAPSQDRAAPLAPRPSEAQTKIRVNSELVVLPVTVKDRFGELVADLQQTDFRIFDNNIEQSVDVFTVEAFPLSLVVLIDDDLKSKDAAQMTPTLRAITAGISASDETLIARFDLSFYPGDAFTSDLDTLWAELKQAQNYSAPSTAGPVPFVSGPFEGCACPVPAAPTKSGHRPTKALDDAVHSAAMLLHDRGTARRKMILVVSDGANGSQFNHHTYGDALEALLRDNISVYSLAVGSSLSKSKFSRLINYADDSGGDIYYASTSAGMEKLYSQITEEARHEYTLAYVPRGANSSSPYHRVEVRVDRPGVSVKTRQGYYTGPPANPAPGGTANHR
jgi:Ca-activated chloride channel family protein